MTPVHHTRAATLVVRRTIAAPVKAVYRTWTDPELVRQWSWGSRHETLDMTLDCRVGGAWHHQIKNRDNGEIWSFDGVFQEVLPDRRLVHTFFWRSGSGVVEGTSLVAIDFISRGETTTEVIITHSRLEETSRDGTREGWEDILGLVDRLARETQARIKP